MIAELHAGDGAARLCAIERRRRREANRSGMRAAVGEVAALGAGAAVASVSLRPPRSQSRAAWARGIAEISSCV